MRGGSLAPWSSRIQVFTDGGGCTPTSITAVSERGWTGFMTATEPLCFGGPASEERYLQRRYRGLAQSFLPYPRRSDCGGLNALGTIAA